MTSEMGDIVDTRGADQQLTLKLAEVFCITESIDSPYFQVSFGES